MTNLAESATCYVNGSQSRWANLVDVALALSPRQVDKGAERLAKLAGEGKVTVKKKIQAIRYAAGLDMKPAEIKTLGQKEVLAFYVRGKVKARTLPLVSFPHKVTQPVRDDLHALVLRVGKVLGLKTYDDCFEFILANYADLSDEELKHLAGEADAPPKS